MKAQSPPSCELLASVSLSLNSGLPSPSTLHSFPSLHRSSFLLLSKLKESAKHLRRQQPLSRKYISSSFLLLKFLQVFELPAAYCTYPGTSHQPHTPDDLEHRISPAGIPGTPKSSFSCSTKPESQAFTFLNLPC